MLISFDGNCIFSKYIHELVGNIKLISFIDEFGYDINKC